MAESESGLDTMRSRIKRASRKPPPPRGATVTDAPVPAAPTPSSEPQEEGLPPTPASPTTTDVASSKPRRTPRAKTSAGQTISPSAPSVNLAIRVREPLDDRLVDLLHSLRRAGVRSSKVELIEMLLWELPEAPDDDLRRRLAAFRERAPRGTGSSAEL